ncbi:MAG TPA: PIN domain-containing protein [Pyrinomonadaceae bacterium]|jgi:predicted nucleic acid-binding protein
MSYLVDTNVLLRSVQTFHPMHSAAVRAIDVLLNNEILSVIPQNFIEFWAVATRAKTSNGLGLTVEEAAARIQFIKSVLQLLPDVDGIFEEWERLVFQHQVLGKQVYDARLVAAMRVHGLTHLLTFNTGDFQRFTEITATSPPAILSDQST